MKVHEFLQTQTIYPSIGTDAVTSATYLYALIENSPIAIVVFDAEHRPTLSNPAFEKLFQYTTKELAATDIDTLIASPELVDEAMGLSQRVLSGINVHTVTQRRRRDGMMVDVEIYGIPLIVDGTLVGVYGLYQDVTERNKAQRAFRKISHRFDTLQQEERARLARDLHDSTSQDLAVLNWNLSRLINVVGEGDDALRKLVAETREIASQCSARIRSASYLLHPPLLGEGGLTVAVPWLAEGFEQRSGIAVTLHISSDLGRFREEIEIAIFRIVQEALANVLRHSGSSVAIIRLEASDHSLSLTVTDHGKESSFHPANAPDSHSGIGISGMRERVEHLGGHFEFVSTPHGTTVTATVPTEAIFHA
jgi:two-component system NarL family sensor kinase